MAECNKKLVKFKSGLKIVAVDETVQSPFLMKDPRWIPDSESSQCCKCKTTFDFFQRRHHCRRCGKCFCGKCCSSKSALPRMCFVDPVLHCESCLLITTKENEFFEIQLKNLVQGAVFYITGTAFGEESGALMKCRLTSDHRYVTLEPEERNPFHTAESIELKRVENTRTVSSVGTAYGLSVKYTDPDEEPHEIQLSVVDKKSGKRAMQWLSAFQQAVKMVLESRNEAR